MENVYCEKHKCNGKKGKWTYYCVQCATEETARRKGRGK